MRRFLIFRTDRIGDFIASKIIIESIKSENKNNKIDIVCSNYNKNYISHYNSINHLFILEKRNLINYLKNIKLLSNFKYDYLILLDGKRRSLIFSFFIKANFKILLFKTKSLSFFIAKLLSYNIFFNSEKNFQFDNFKKLLKIIKIPPKIQFNYYKDYKFKKRKTFKFKNFLHLHLDEKWFEGYHYSDFNYMGLNANNINNFLFFLLKKFKKKIVITSGFKKISTLDEIINLNFEKKKLNFQHKLYKSKIIFLKNLDFRDLELLVKQCEILIACEGAISHVSNSLNIPSVILIQKNRKQTALFWTGHMNNINRIYRSPIKNVMQQINKIKL